MVLLFIYLFVHCDTGDLNSMSTHCLPQPRPLVRSQANVTWWCKNHTASHGPYAAYQLSKTMEECKEICLANTFCKSVIIHIPDNTCFALTRNWRDNNYSNDTKYNLCEIGKVYCSKIYAKAISTGRWGASMSPAISPLVCC